MYIPANPILRKPITNDNYHIYCGDVEKLRILAVVIEDRLDDKKDIEVNFNENFGVWEFYCESDEEKIAIDELFDDRTCFIIELEDDDEDIES